MDGNWARGGHFFFIEKCVTRNQALMTLSGCQSQNIDGSLDERG